MADVIQRRLLRWAAVFLFLYSIILTLSPAVRERSFDVTYRWSHWLGFAIWVVLIIVADRATMSYLPERDPYLLPAAALLSGWGLLTIWRLDSSFGLRQMIWLVICIGIFIAGLRLPSSLNFLRRYKYLLLSSGLLLTALTLLFGTNPGGYGPRLWLGCCGIYFQPSEPLKLLLIIYLAAYLADRLPIPLRIFPLILPTLLVTGLALLILLIQQDLGTASIFILLFTVILYMATDRRRTLIGTGAALALAGLVGYFFISVIHIRVNAWLNPWNDPSGHSYQIVQSLLAIANGGTIGRGPGLGSPTLVPVALSDFIFAAITEENGLIGIIGLLTVFGLILSRGMRAALRAPDRFRRLLAGGLTAYIGIQSLVIIGGNLRLLPLTGVTLPFVSYGGSSLLTSFIAILLLLIIGGQAEEEPAQLNSARPYSIVSILLGLGLAAAALSGVWWTVIRGPDLLARTDNPRRAIADRYVPRGNIIDREDNPIDTTVGASGSYERKYLYPDLGPVTGYTQPVFGQAGLEASLDDYLRGLQGNPSSLLWWDYLLYGTPPPGLDVRLSLDLSLQANADRMLGNHPGAVILLNSQSGEILVMASHPTFDPNLLNEQGSSLVQNPHAPLLNRAAQGLYVLGTLAQPLIQAQFGSQQPNEKELGNFYNKLGFYQAPQLRLPVAPAPTNKATSQLRVSPLQVALAAAALSNHGTVPASRIALAVKTPQQGWVILPALNQPVQAIQSSAADEAAQAFASTDQPYWHYSSQTSENNSTTSWFMGGTLPNLQGTPLTVVVALEEDNARLAKQIGQSMFDIARQP
ncbi:MAG TPA: FtsW/RodA/SpoVE family cell cycle protein [Anaerolineales bacterium]|nr:FtsW/RodA/SpoVE family cell cycle protein [Anaerolineales bacterium]